MTGEQHETGEESPLQSAREPIEFPAPPTSFAELHRRYASMVHAILLTLVPPGECEDLLQEVFLQIFRKWDALREPVALGGWIRTITRNKARDHHRRRRTWEALPDDLPARGDIHVEHAAREALAAIRALPEAYRETLAMRLVEGMTGPEIAEVMGMTPGSVRVNLHRGMRLLRERLGAATEMRERTPRNARDET